MQQQNTVTPKVVLVAPVNVPETPQENPEIKPRRRPDFSGLQTPKVVLVAPVNVPETPQENPPKIQRPVRQQRAIGVQVGDEENSLLFKNIKNKDIKKVEAAIAIGANVNSIEENGNTPLHIAVELRNIEISQRLIEFGANINSKNKNGNTPLHVAAGLGDFEISKLFIELGANAKILNNDSKKPSDLAFDNGHKEMSNAIEKLRYEKKISPFLKHLEDEIRGLKAENLNLREGLRAHGIFPPESKVDGSASPTKTDAENTPIVSRLVIK